MTTTSSDDRDCGGWDVDYILSHDDVRPGRRGRGGEEEGEEGRETGGLWRQDVKHIALDDDNSGRATRCQKRG